MLADLWAGGLIGFREALEATLIIVIFLLILEKSGQNEMKKSIWKGVGFGILASIITAIIFEFVIGSFEDNEAWFEGALMLTASALIAFVILHLIKHHSKEQLEEIAKNAMQDSENGVKALMVITFLSVWREGSETVVFLSAGTETSWAIVGMLIGIAIAVVLGWAMMKKGVQLDIQKIFSITTLLLVFVGAGLAAHGVHELQEEDAGIIPIIDEELWNVNPEWDKTGEAPLLHDKGAIGGLFRAMLGWNGDPTLLEFVTWVAYLGTLGYILKRNSSDH